jgi:hypothetical protein
MEKICNKCEEVKEINNFYKNSKNDGYRSICKRCHNEKTKIYRIINKDTIKQSKKNWRKNNIDSILENDKLKRDNLTIDEKVKISEYNKKWRESNKEIEKVKKQDYYKENKDVFLLKAKIYRENNKDYIKNYQLNYKETKNNKRNERLKNDVIYKLEKSIRSNIYDIFKRNGYKKSSRTSKILGCSYEDFKLYLESKFEDWMNWNNRGLYNGELNYGWDIDHIIPISSANTEDDIIKLNHYKNLQPLCSYTNIYIKMDKYLNT